jgi:predicted NAD-dependent protein-ADP-ribosyltransferase YbiA (DUF1768 family)
MESNNNQIVNMFRHSPWPGNILSNFSQTPFTLDDIHCACSESFIQSLKFPDVAEQKTFCSLQGEEAWARGSKFTENVFLSGKVWWIGESYTLHSAEHFELIKKGLSAKFTQSTEARDALLASGDSKLTHDYGQLPSKKQSLPVEVFCQIVTQIRCDLQGGMA